MATLQIRELPVQIYEKLKREADKEHRSLAQQATIALAKGLSTELNPKERRVRTLKELEVLKDQAAEYKLSDPVNLIREDRKQMTAVLDASAAIVAALNKTKASEFSKYIAAADWIIVPDIFIPEVTNTFWKYHVFEDLPIHQSEVLLSKTLSLIDEVIDSNNLYQEAFALACNLGHPVYDVLYMIVARRFNATLITADKRLRKLAEKQSIKTI